MVTKNLGQVQAIWVGTTPPTNTNMIWWDLNVTLHKYYKTATSTWETFVINSATAPLSRSGDSIVLLFNSDQFEIVAGALKIKDDVLLSVLPAIAISDITGLITALSNKVTVVTGKSLVSDIEIARLAFVTQYTHPTNHPPSIISQDESNRFVTDTQIDTWNNKQDALGFVPYAASNPDGYIKASDLTTINIPLSVVITLPSAGSVASRCSGASAGTDYPTDWTIAADVNPNDIIITHTLSKKVMLVTIFTNNGTNDIQYKDSEAFMGIAIPASNKLVIQGLATTAVPISINILFA